MAEQATLVANIRDDKGSSNARRIRAAGEIPAIMYDSGNEAVALSLNEHEFEGELRRHSSENVMIDIEVGDQGMTKVLIKEVQHHPLTGRILHVDLQSVSMTETLRVSVAIELEGEPVGVTQFGGVLEQLLREAEVECLPADIPSVLIFDVSELGVGEGLNLDAADLDADKVTMISDGKIAVAHVSAPRVATEDGEEEGEEGEEGEAAPAEPEVIGAKSEDEEA